VWPHEITGQFRSETHNSANDVFNDNNIIGQHIKRWYQILPTTFIRKGISIIPSPYCRQGTISWAQVVLNNEKWKSFQEQKVLSTKKKTVTFIRWIAASLVPMLLSGWGSVMWSYRWTAIRMYSKFVMGVTFKGACFSIVHEIVVHWFCIQHT